MHDLAAEPGRSSSKHLKALLAAGAVQSMSTATAVGRGNSATRSRRRVLNIEYRWDRTTARRPPGRLSVEDRRPQTCPQVVDE